MKTNKIENGLSALRQLAIINLMIENKNFSEIVKNYLRNKTYCEINSLKTNDLAKSFEALQAELKYRDLEITKEMERILNT